MYGEGLSRLMSGGAPCCFSIVVTSQRLAGTGRLGTGDLQVADDQFHLALEFNLVHGGRRQ